MLIPLYIYPVDDTGTPVDAYAAVTALAESRPELAVVVIVNPGNGPGQQRDPNYQRAINNLAQSGAVVVGYVATGFGSRTADEIVDDVERWNRWYSGVSGIFLDEVAVPADYGDWISRLFPAFQRVRDAIDADGYRLVVANPGTDVPRTVYESDLFDIVVAYENNRWPPRSLVPTSFAPTPDLARKTAVLIYGSGVWNRERFREVARGAGFLFVNDHSLDATGAGAYDWNYLPSNLTEQAAMLAERAVP